MAALRDQLAAAKAQVDELQAQLAEAATKIKDTEALESTISELRHQQAEQDALAARQAQEVEALREEVEDQRAIARQRTRMLQRGSPDPWAPGPDTTRQSNQSNNSGNKDYKVDGGAPDKYWGTPEEDLPQFLAELDIYMHWKGATAETDNAKNWMLATFLKGAALQWWRTELRENPSPPWWNDHQACRAELSRVFDGPDKERVAKRAIAEVRMEGQFDTAHAYWVRFRALAVDIPSWTDSTRKDKFYEGLTGAIKDELAKQVQEPETFKELADLCMRIDDRISDREKDKAAERRIAPRPRRSIAERVANTPGPNSRKPLLDRFKSNSMSGPGGVKCYLCGETGHPFKICPTRRQGASISEMEGSKN